MSASGEHLRVEFDELASPASGSVLTPEALAFVGKLERQFGATRSALLEKRVERQRALDAGIRPNFLSETARMRDGSWSVAPAPADLDDRRVEITGPAERKMMINALNSGANVFMADLEDSLSPTWNNVVEGQSNLMQAVRRTLEFTSEEGKHYQLVDRTATLVVRPRGWHLTERHVRLGGEPLSASLFDFGLYFFHNAQELVRRGTGPYFYLPKLESHIEARLWNDVFNFAQDTLGVPRGTIRATVLIETILAAFEMDEILHELRDHAAGLNAGRWDYIFSAIKKLRECTGEVFPDRAQVTMGVPFMRAYAQLLVRTCHHRGAHAIGGMAAFIPSRRDAGVNETALRMVREDKEREAADGFDGTWVAHPDLVPVAKEVFDRTLGERPHQKDKLREDVKADAEALLDLRIPRGVITPAGVRTNISVALQYIEAWLRGSGAVAINNLMEDAATAEISRSQLWQWVRCRARMSGGAALTPDLYLEMRRQELSSLTPAFMPNSRFREAAELLDLLVLADQFTEFLTIPASSHLP